MRLLRLRTELGTATAAGGCLAAVDALAHGGHAVPAGVSEGLHLHLLPGLGGAISPAPLLAALALGALALALRRRRRAAGDRRQRG